MLSSWPERLDPKVLPIGTSSIVLCNALSSSANGRSVGFPNDNGSLPMLRKRKEQIQSDWRIVAAPVGRPVQERHWTAKLPQYVRHSSFRRCSAKAATLLEESYTRLYTFGEAGILVPYGPTDHA